VTARISEILASLEEQSNRERSGEVRVVPENEMLAITSDTGLFFRIILNAMQAKRILEIGTSVGYSTLWFADALLQNGVTEAKGTSKPIMTIEKSESKVRRATKNFNEAGVSDIIELLQGRAKDILYKLLENLEGLDYDKRKTSLFDFVFLDADKENLTEYFELVLRMLRPGGIIATDNMLYPDEYRPQMLKYSNFIRSKPHLQSVTVPIGNGEEITIKLS
jgi:predicted O-methyltransferase YrrM